LFRISLTGEIGVGKMTLLRAVLERLPEGIDVVVVFNTRCCCAGCPAPRTPYS
jgi:nucleoside-triphosphatase THEP1